MGCQRDIVVIPVLLRNQGVFNLILTLGFFPLRGKTPTGARVVFASLSTYPSPGSACCEGAVWEEKFKEDLGRIVARGRVPRHLEPVWVLHPLPFPPKARDWLGEAKEATGLKAAWTGDGEMGKQESGNSKEHQLLNGHSVRHGLGPPKPSSPFPGTEDRVYPQRHKSHLQMRKQVQRGDNKAPQPTSG